MGNLSSVILVTIAKTWSVTEHGSLCGIAQLGVFAIDVSGTAKSMFATIHRNKSAQVNVFPLVCVKGAEWQMERLRPCLGSCRTVWLMGNDVAEAKASIETFQFQWVVWRLEADYVLGTSLYFYDVNNWVRVGNVSENSLSPKKNHSRTSGTE